MVIRDLKQKTKFKHETQYELEHYEPVTCPECGEETVYRYSTEKYGGSKEGCFSEQCTKPMNIGMIRGDIRYFSVKEYGIPGTPEVIYKNAKEAGYSDQLRNAVKTQMESWGFSKITFKKPGENSNECHTIISGVHKDPMVNIHFKNAPKSNHILCFDNKYGVVCLVTGYHEKEDKSYYTPWSRAGGYLDDYLKANNKPNTYYNQDKLIILPNRENLRIIHEDGILSAKKDKILSDIRKRLTEIKTHTVQINGENEIVEKLYAKYRQDFGEDAPPQKSLW